MNRFYDRYLLGYCVSSWDLGSALSSWADFRGTRILSTSGIHSHQSEIQYCCFGGENWGQSHRRQNSIGRLQGNHCSVGSFTTQYLTEVSLTTKSS